MSTPNTVKTQLQNLIDFSNRKTGKSNTDLTGAVNTLIDERESILSGEDITELYSDVTLVRGGAIAFIPNLISVTLPNALSIGYQGLSNNASLKNVYIPQVSYMEYFAFYRNKALEYLDIPEIKTLSNNVFNECDNLKYVNLHKVDFISNNVFTKCISLIALIITRRSTVATLQNTNAFTETPIASGTGYIYVPRDLIETYKTATNWTTYASQFRVLEDYTVDGTIDGELDWDKINGGAV